MGWGHGYAFSLLWGNASPRPQCDPRKSARRRLHIAISSHFPVWVYESFQDHKGHSSCPQNRWQTVYQCAWDDVSSAVQTKALFTNVVLALECWGLTTGHIFTAPSRNEISGEKKISKIRKSPVPRLKNWTIFFFSIWKIENWEIRSQILKKGMKSEGGKPRSRTEEWGLLCGQTQVTEMNSLV